MYNTGKGENWQLKRRDSGKSIGLIRYFAQLWPRVFASYAADLYVLCKCAVQYNVQPLPP